MKNDYEGLNTAPFKRNNNGIKGEELKDECLDRLNSTSRIKLAWWSFRNNFNVLQHDFPSIDLSDRELEHFILVCDYRLDRAKTFLSEIALVLGFDLTALTIVAFMVKFKLHDPVLSILSDGEGTRVVYVYFCC